MKAHPGWRRILSWLGGLALVCLMGCEPRGFVPPPLPPPPPPAPAPPPQVSRPTFYVSANRLNLRACPGMDCPKISLLEHNEEVEKVGDAEDWAQVRVKRDGRLGWVNSRYLSSTPLPAAPEAAPPPPEVTPPPLPEEAPPPPKPPVAEKPKPEKAEKAPPAVKKKAEERPAKPKAGEAAGPGPRKPAPAAEKAAPPAEKAPEPTPEAPKRIRIM